MIGPARLAAIEKAGTDSERALAVELRDAWRQVAESHVLLARMRLALRLGIALQVENAIDDDDWDDHVQEFRSLALAAIEPTATDTYLRVCRLIHALQLMVDTKKPREYYAELAREALQMDSKDAAARGLAKLDLNRRMTDALVMVDPNTFAQRYVFAAADDGDVTESSSP